jgi:hypothetical protein
MNINRKPFDNQAFGNTKAEALEVMELMYNSSSPERYPYLLPKAHALIHSCFSFFVILLCEENPVNNQ